MVMVWGVEVDNSCVCGGGEQGVTESVHYILKVHTQ